MGPGIRCGRPRGLPRKRVHVQVLLAARGTMPTTHERRSARKVTLAALQYHIGSLDSGSQWRKSGRLACIPVSNPNCSDACSAGISQALPPFPLAGGPFIDVVTLKEGPP